MNGSIVSVVVFSMCISAACFGMDETKGCNNNNNSRANNSFQNMVVSVNLHNNNNATASQPSQSADIAPEEYTKKLEELEKRLLSRELCHGS